jgi:hypothetical protein
MRGSYISMGGSLKENFSIFDEKLSLEKISRKFLEIFSRNFLRNFLFTTLGFTQNLLFLNRLKLSSDHKKSLSNSNSISLIDLS